MQLQATTAKAKAMLAKDQSRETGKVPKEGTQTERAREKARETEEEVREKATCKMPEGAAQVPSGKDWAGRNPHLTKRAETTSQ